MVGGGKRKQSRKRKQKQRYTRKQRKSQIGGAGYTFDMADMLMKEPARVTTACQMPRPPTQFGGSYNRQSQIGGGGALVGSPIASMTESIGGTTQPSSALVYPATTAAYSFDLAGSKNLKGIYAAVAPMDGRVGPVSCRSRKRGRKHA